jgi:Protein of unknown function (DUF2842)
VRTSTVLLSHPVDALQPKAETMPRRLRKLVGTVLMLLFVLIYALVVTAVAAPILTNASKVTQAVFYLVAGLAWAPPLMLLIKWMEGGRDDTRPTGPV